jgi:phospholipid/cholesterol/gamma-HCH transport system substrate-binding protein
VISRVVAIVAAVLVIAGLATVIGGSSGDSFRVRLSLEDAHGLRKGTDVKVAGVKVGRVSRIRLGRHDVVEVELAVDRGKAQLRRDASAAIRSANLLGQKFVDLRPGDGAAAPSGVRIPRARVTISTGLDQVYSVLDSDTRTRLGIMINEAGRALTGRAADFNALVGALPQDLNDATRVVGELVQDNHSLERLVARGERFVDRIAAERHALADAVRAAGGAMRSVSARRSELAATLRRAPGTLATFRSFLLDLRSTAQPLGRAARALSAAAPPLSATLDALEPFRVAAAPALRTAAATAPALSRLATRATPVLRRAQPPVAALDTLARTAPPLTTALDTGIDDLLGFVEGWARAIQTRDGPGHIFRGHVSLGPAAIRSAVANLLQQQAAREAPKSRPRPAPRVAAPPPDRRRPAPTAPPTAPEPGLLDTLPGTVEGLLEPLSSRLPLDKLGLPGQGAPGLTPLLDYLLEP